MPLVKYYDKRVGITYVYDSKSYYDKEKKQSRAHRKLVGKIDPETGEIVPTGKIGRPPKDPAASVSPQDEKDVDYKKLYEKSLRDLTKRDDKIAALNDRIAALEQEVSVYKKTEHDVNRGMKTIIEVASRIANIGQ